MDNKIIEVLNYLGDKFNIAIDWTGDNVLPYVKELCNKFIKWELRTSIAWIVIAVVLAVVLWIVSATCFKVDEEDIAISFGIGALFVTIIAVIITCFQVFDIIECNTFPEKVLFDYIENYMNNSN